MNPTPAIALTHPIHRDLCQHNAAGMSWFPPGRRARAEARGSVSRCRQRGGSAPRAARLTLCCIAFAVHPVRNEGAWWCRYVCVCVCCLDCKLWQMTTVWGANQVGISLGDGCDQAAGVKCSAVNKADRRTSLRVATRLTAPGAGRLVAVQQT